MEKENMIRAVIRLQKGDQDAAAEIYEAFQPDLSYFILKTVNDRELAEDLTQDTFIEILQTIDKLQEPAAFPAWARQIAYHKCTAYFRKRHELLADENEDGGTVFDTVAEERAEFIPDEALDKEDLKQTILAMVNELPQEQRVAIVLRYYNEASVSQIAQIQGVSENTVKSRLNYGRKSIKQAVEAYEKRSGVKLRVVGIVPLLLWLYRQQAIATGVSITTKTASAAIAGAASAGGTTVASAAATAGAKTVGKLAIKKIIAGVVAATVVAGGVTAAVLLSKDEPEPMTWLGYGDCGGTVVNKDRMEMTLDVLEDDKISGHIEVSYLYESIQSTDFSGTGEKQEDGTILYTITMTEPYIVYFLGNEIYEHELIYDPQTKTFTMDHFYEVTLQRTDRIENETYGKNVRYSGYGEDGLYRYSGCNCKEHLFEFDLELLSTQEIRGHLTLSKDGNVDHDTDFVGRGFELDGVVYYEVDLAVERTKNYVLTCTQDIFWICYNIEEDTVEISDAGGLFYEVVAQRAE